MKPKVLLLARLYLPHIGGVEKHIEKISEKLSKKYNISLITHKYDPRLKDFEIIKGVSVYRLPNVEKFAVWRWLFFHLSLLKSADIIHIHDVFYWYLPFRLLFPFKKVFMTFHGYEGADAPNWKQIFWHRLAALLTQGNICIGGFHQKYYGVKPTFVSYGAV